MAVIRPTAFATLKGLRLAVPPDEDDNEQYDLTAALRGPILIGGRKLRPNDDERALLERHAKALFDQSGGAPLPLAKALAIITRERDSVVNLTSSTASRARMHPLDDRRFTDRGLVEHV